MNKPQLAALVVLLLLAAGLRLWVSGDQRLHPWDERYHALVAQNLVEHPLKPTLYDDPALPYDYREWTNNQVWLHKPPVALWAMAGSLHLFGTSLWAMRLPSVLFGTGTVLFVFLLGRRLFGVRAGLWAAAFAAANGPALNLVAGRVATDHVDTAFVFFLSAAAWAGFRLPDSGKWRDAAAFGLLTGLAIGTKWLTAGFLFPVIALAVWPRLRRKPLRTLGQGFFAFCLAAILPLCWHIYTHAKFPLEAAWESAYNRRHLFEALEGHAHGFWWHSSRLADMFGRAVWPVLLLALVAFVVGTKPQKRFSYAALAAWILIPWLVFSLAATKMAHYLMIIGPPLWILLGWAAAQAWAMLCGTRGSFVAKPAKMQGLAKGLVGALILFGLWWFPLDKTGRAIDPAHKERGEAWWHNQLQTLRAFSDEHADERVVFCQVHYPIEAMFWTGATCYAWVPFGDQWDNRDTSRLWVIVARPQDDVPAWAIDDDVQVLRTGP